MKLLLLLLPILSVIAAPVCRPVSGDRILGSDLAAANAKFSSLPATLQLGYAPTPGTARTFTSIELQQIARANGLAIPQQPDLCFEIPLHAPSEEEFVASIRHSLPREATVHLLDMARAPIPPGKVEFPLSGLEPPAVANDGAQLWRGFVQYTNTRRAPIWARAIIAVTYTAVVARKDIPADIPIDAASLEVETRTGPLKHAEASARIQDVAGRVVSQRLSAGAEIRLSLIAEPPAFRRGDLVRVEVQSGPAVLHFDAVAETTARVGELADFRNPLSGKTFRARAEAGAKAVVIVGGGSRL